LLGFSDEIRADTGWRVRTLEGQGH
jgi:hypothetical protein